MSSAASPELGELCPLCGEPSAPAHRPFCSRRCQDRDLLKWLGDGYRVPGPPAGAEEIGSGEDALDRER